MDLQNTLFTVQLGRRANIHLANAVIDIGDDGATIQFSGLETLLLKPELPQFPFKAMREPKFTEVPARRARMPAYQRNFYENAAVKIPQKKELATKMKANFSLRCQLDDVPVQTELIQYERRFSELYAQIQEKHHLTRRHYATYNALLEIKELMLKEASLLNSINLQFKDAMTTPSGRSKLLDSMEVIVKGTKHKLEKVKLDLLAEQKVCDSLKEKHTIAVAEQRHFSSLLKTFQDACTEYERLRQLAST